MESRIFCDDFEETIKKRIISNHENSTTDSKENVTLRIDEVYDWSCLTGCPPGFHCSENGLETCTFGASNIESKSCSSCPNGHVCIPGRLPYPCPLGQYVKAELVHGAEKIIFAGTEFGITTKYTCNDCPSEFFPILDYSDVGDSELTARLNIGEQIPIFDRSFLSPTLM